MISGSEGASWLGSAGQLANSLTRIALDLTLSFPSVALHALPQLVSTPPDLEGIGRYLRDTGRVAERVFRGAGGLGSSAPK